MSDGINLLQEFFKSHDELVHLSLFPIPNDRHLVFSCLSGMTRPRLEQDCNTLKTTFLSEQSHPTSNLEAK
jgi:hypothetical protein